MTLEEAIGRLEQHRHYLESLNALEQVEAHRLGIEALKLLEHPTDPRLIYARKLLLGETKE